MACRVLMGKDNKSVGHDDNILEQVYWDNHNFTYKLLPADEIDRYDMTVIKVA